MYEGKTLFAQIMDFLPWSTFQRIVTRYGGDYRIRTFRCTEQFRIIAFAQCDLKKNDTRKSQKFTAISQKFKFHRRFVCDCCKKRVIRKVIVIRNILT
jgi:hypothetical protein